MTIGLLSFAAPSGFNGGRSQVNLSFLQTGGDYPFLNTMKTAQAWSFLSGNAPVTPDILESNGYPTSIVHGGVYTVFFVPTQASRRGNYVITWTGNGTIFCGMSNTAQGGTTKIGSGGSGRYVFSTTDNRFVIGITALPVTNLQVFHADDEASLLAGNVFSDNAVRSFKQRLKEANFGVIRFLNWQGNSNNGGNGTNVTTWATRKPLGYVFYNDYELRSALYCTTPTSLTGTKYSATGPSGFALVDKATIHFLVAQSYSSSAVTFTNGSASILKPAHGLAVNARIAFSLDPNNPSTIPTNFLTGTKYYVVSVPDADHITVSATQGGSAINAGSPQVGLIYGDPFLTLNISGTGDIDLLGEHSSFLSFGENSYPIGGTWQSIATVVYDATLNAWIKQGGDVALNSVGINNGCPPELMVRLCAEVGAHPHFVTPPLAIDPATDYMPSLAAYCQANGPSWMIPRFEGPNELWNTAAGFFQTGYANAKATAYNAADPTHWAAGDFHNWYGKVMSVLGQAVSTVYGNDRTRYQVLCGVQTAQGDTSGDRANSNPRLASTSFLAQTAPAQSGYTKSAASGWVTHGCCAQYFGPSDQGTGTETTLAANFAGKAFAAWIASGVMTVTALNASNSAALAVGDTIFDTEIFAVDAIPSGVTITSLGTGAGGLGTYNISNSSIVVGTSALPQNMTAATDLTAPNTYADTSNTGSGAFNIPNVALLYAGWKVFFQSFGIQKMCGYEGGYSPDYSGANGNYQIDMLKSASKLDVNLGAFTTTNYSNFVGLTGSGFTAEFPSCFMLSGNPNEFGYSNDAWSIIEDRGDLCGPSPSSGIGGLND